MAQAVRRSSPIAGVEFTSRSLDMGFRSGRNGVWVGFLQISPVFPCHKFHSTISPHSSHSFHFISSVPVKVRQAWSASILAIHRPAIQGLRGISYLDPALCRTRGEDIYFTFPACAIHKFIVRETLRIQMFRRTQM